MLKARKAAPAAVDAVFTSLTCVGACSKLTGRNFLQRSLASGCSVARSFVAALGCHAPHTSHVHQAYANRTTKTQLCSARRCSATSATAAARSSLPTSSPPACDFGLLMQHRLTPACVAQLHGQRYTVLDNLFPEALAGAVVRHGSPRADALQGNAMCTTAC